MDIEDDIKEIIDKGIISQKDFDECVGYFLNMRDDYYRRMMKMAKEGLEENTSENVTDELIMNIKQRIEISEKLDGVGAYLERISFEKRKKMIDPFMRKMKKLRREFKSRINLSIKVRGDNYGDASNNPDNLFNV